MIAKSPETVTERRPGRPRDARADEAIVEATLDLVNVHGVAGLSVDTVAAYAGCSKATIYRRWASKEELVIHALSRGSAPIESPDTGTLRGDLERYFDLTLERLSAGRVDVLPHLVQAGAGNAALQASLDEYLAQRREPLRAVLRRGARRGELAAGADIELLIDALLGPMIYRRLFSARKVDRAFARRLIDLFVPRPGG